jgi:hypothetical protein
MKTTLDFGSNYGPHIERVRDFYPRWIECQWNEATTVRDLTILRALGARRVRFHILPARYEQDGYPGATADDYRRLIPLALRTSRSLGLKTHVDLHTDDYATLTVEPLLERLAEFGPDLIDTLQVVNEYFFLWKDDANLRRQAALLARLRATGFAGELCFDAGGVVHRHMRGAHPELAAHMAAMLPLHYYPAGNRWDAFNVDVFLDVLDGGQRAKAAALSPERGAFADGMAREHFGGLAPELRVMETNLVGDFFGSATVPDERGALWPALMRRVAAETNVSTVCTWCLLGKMSWREYGFSQSGMLYACGLPRPEAHVFRDTALAMMPEDDLFTRFDVCVEPPVDGRVRIRVTSRSDEPATGELRLASGVTRPVRLAPRGVCALEFVLAEALGGGEAPGVRHLLAEFVPAPVPAGTTGRCVGWRAVLLPQPIRLASDVRFPVAGVVYPDGLEPVVRFLEVYRERLCILVEQPAAPETELAIRLQSVIAEACGVLPEVACTLLGAEDQLRDRALILLGTRGQNALLRCVECRVEARHLPPADAPGAVISAQHGLFHRKPVVDRWAVAHVRKSIGDARFSPGAVLVMGSSFATLRDAVYDLIQRLSPPGPAAQPCDDAHTPLGDAGFPLDGSRAFGVCLPPGDYRVELVVGSRRHAVAYATRATLAGTSPAVERLTAPGQMARVEQRLRHPGGMLVCRFEPAASGQRACPTALRVLDASTGAHVFQAYFSATILVALDYEGFRQITGAVVLDQTELAGDWQEIRDDANQDLRRHEQFGWVSGTTIRSSADSFRNTRPQ